MKRIFCLWLFCIGSCTVLAQKKYLIYKTEDGYDVSPKSHHNYVHKAQPFNFGYNIKDAKGNSQYHKEESDEHNYRKGSYGYTDAYGIFRHVDYVADHEGFRAKVRTNEPGMANVHPAHVYMHAEEPPHHLQTLHHQYTKPAPKYHYQDKAQHYQQEPKHHHQEDLYHDQKQEEDLYHNQKQHENLYHNPKQQKNLYHAQKQQENLYHAQKQQENLYHTQKQQEYEEYLPNPKEKVTYVPVYAPYGNSRANEYHHQ